MPTIVGILIFVSRINNISKCIKPGKSFTFSLSKEKSLLFSYFSFYEPEKFHASLSLIMKSLITSGTDYQNIQTYAKKKYSDI